MNLAEMIQEADRLSKKIDEGVRELSNAASEQAEAEHIYRLEKARAWIEISDGTAGERAARVDGVTAGFRRDRDLAEARRQTAVEALRSRRAQLSMLQTAATSLRAELDHSTYGTGQ